MIVNPTLIVIICITFALVWLFINTIDKRKWLTFIVSLALTPIAYFYLIYPMINIFSSYHHEKYFDTTVWKKQPALRYEMQQHLIKDSLLIHKNKEAIKALLGKAEWYGWDDTLKANSENKWNYNLGFLPGAFNNMQECIELQFTNNKVTSVRSYQLEKTFE